MEKLVISLETAQKLKAAGFPQEGFFCYSLIMRTNDGGYERREMELSTAPREWSELFRENSFAAPTAQEIADQLPHYCDQRLYTADLAYRLSISKGLNDRWTAEYPTTYLQVNEADTMAEALALLWLKLQEAK